MSETLVLDKTNIQLIGDINADKYTFWNDRNNDPNVINGYHVRPSLKAIIGKGSDSECGKLGTGWYWRPADEPVDGYWMLNANPGCNYQKSHAGSNPYDCGKRIPMTGDYLACRKDLEVPDNRVPCCLVNAGFVSDVAQIPDEGLNRTVGNLLLLSLNDVDNKQNRTACRANHRNVLKYTNMGIKAYPEPEQYSIYTADHSPGEQISPSNLGDECLEVIADWCYQIDPEDSYTPKRFRVLTNEKCKQWATAYPAKHLVKMTEYCQNNPSDQMCSCVARMDPNSADYDLYKTLSTAGPLTTNAGCWYIKCQNPELFLTPPEFLNMTNCPKLTCRNILEVVDSSAINLSNIKEYVNCDIESDDNGGDIHDNTNDNNSSHNSTNNSSTSIPTLNLTWWIVGGLSILFLMIVIALILLR